MNTKRLSLLVLVLLSLSCNAVTRAFQDEYPTGTPQATLTPTITPDTTLPGDEVYTPPSCQGNPVATIPPATTVAESGSGLGTDPSISKDEQLRVFDQLTKKITDIYLYPDFNGLDWPGTVVKYRAKIKSGLDTETFYTEMSNLMAELGDEHSQFFSPVEKAASNAELSGQNDYVGIGIYVVPMVDKDRIVILSVLPDSSAEHGGLKQHDSILAVDGLPIIQDGIPHTEWVRGPECSAVRLTVESPGQKPRDITFIRYHITAGLPITGQLVPTADGSRIGYIFLPSFYDETIPEQVKTMLENFGPLDGLIIDNRMNGGGSSDIVESILSYFTSGTVGRFVSRTKNQPLKISSDPIHNSQTVPLVVLVGTDTVSFGEIFSGLLQDIGRAKVVGQTTLGNVETLGVYDFDDGSEAWIAQERFTPLHTKADWEKTGIIPDVEAYADWDTFTFENDPSVAGALKLLGHK